MPKITLTWDCDTPVDSFEVIRSDTSLAAVADVDLPTPIATGITPIKTYDDTTVVTGNAYYYKVRAKRGSASAVSEQLITQAGDPHFANVVSLLHFNNDNITDEKSKTWTAVGSPICTTNLSKKALYLNGSNSAIYATIDLSGTQDLTIEFFMSLVHGGHGSVWSRLVHTGQGNESGAFNIVCASSENPTRLLTSVWTPSEIGDFTDSTLANNTIHHVAAVRTSGGTWKTYVNGVEESGFTSSQNLSKTRFSIGYNGNYNEYAHAYIYSLRITKGVARYTADFTPPILPFPNS